MNSKYLHCSFYVDLKLFLFWNRNLELKAAHVWNVRWMALVQVSCCPLLRSDAASWVRNTEDSWCCSARKESAAVAELCTKIGKSWWHV